jgi:putative ABC transport system permease protein
MSPLLTLAVRNVARSKARSALTTGAITLGIFMSLMMGAVIHGTHRWLIDDAIKGKVGALQVHRRGYFEQRDRQPLKLDMEQGGALQATLEATPGVAAVSPRIAFAGMVSNGSTATLFTAQALVPQGEARVLPWASREVEGRWLEGAGARAGVLGTELAGALEVVPGATLSLQATTQAGKENVLDVDLVGTNSALSILEGKRLAWVPLSFAQELLGMEGRATEYVLAVQEGADVDQVASHLRTTLGADYEVHTWAELNPALLEAMALQRAILMAIGLLFLIIAIAGVVNTLLMSVLERTREIGTMMAVGVRRGKVGVLFVLEAVVQALLGGALGVAAAHALVALLVSRGGIVFAVGNTQSLTIIPEVAGDQVVVAVVASTLGAIFAALWPALRAARLNPVDALRGA